MPAYSKIKKEEHTGLIRRLLAIDPMMTTREIRWHLEGNGLRLDRDYIAKLRDKIFRRRSQRLRRDMLARLMEEYSGTLVKTDKIAWRIVFSPTSSDRDKLTAIGEIRKSNSDFIDRFLVSGVSDIWPIENLI